MCIHETNEPLVLTVRASEHLNHTDDATDALVERLELISRHPQLSMLARAHDLLFKAREILRIDVERRDDPDEVRDGITCVPLSSDLCSVILVQYWVEEGLLGQAKGKPTSVERLDGSPFGESHRSVECSVHHLSPHPIAWVLSSTPPSDVCTGGSRGVA